MVLLGVGMLCFLFFRIRFAVSFAVPAVSGNAAAAPVINQTYGSSFSRLCETMPIAMSVYNTQHMNQAFLSIGVRVTAPT